MVKSLELGDIVSFNRQFQITKLRQQPIDVLIELDDLENPKFDYKKIESAPEDDGNWLIVEVRDLFNRFGRRKRICKVSNIITSSSGWVPVQALDLVVSYA